MEFSTRGRFFGHGRGSRTLYNSAWGVRGLSKWVLSRPISTLKGVLNGAMMYYVDV